MNLLQETKELLGRVFKPFTGEGEKLISQKIGKPKLIEIDLRSEAFEDDGPIPLRYSGEGANTSPPFTWKVIPPGTKEWVLICEDPDAPRAEPFIHWVAYHIAPQSTSLPEDIPLERTPDLACGLVQGFNSKNTVGYTGPMPPVGHGVHHYHFQLFAVDTELRLGRTPTRMELLHALEEHTIGWSELVGTYERT